jgi:hypothetical protein
MSRTEELRDDPSAGKSGASPSESGTGEKSRTVMADPDTRTEPASQHVPQSSPVPNTLKDLAEARKIKLDRGPVVHKDS